MRSLNARLLIAASIVLVAFLGLTGFALDQAFRRSALTAVQDRLQAQVYMLLSAASFRAAEARMMPKTLPDPRLSTPSSGLYAQVARHEGKSNRLIWRSASLLGLTLPVSPAGTPGVPQFDRVRASDRTPLFMLSFTVRYELRKGNPRLYTVEVAETTQGYNDQVRIFRQSLWGWLAAAAAGLLAMQALILRWGLTPLRRVAAEVIEVESGRQPEISGDYPRELQGLVINLNALIRNSKAHLERYRRALGDLAHSFKTPLAVLRGAAEGDSGLAGLRTTVSEQVDRLDRTVAYQLHRAAASGRSAMATPIAVEPVVVKIVQSLNKVYGDRRLKLAADVSHGVEFYGDEGDLMEIIGNLADNACKWARTQVVIRARTGPAEAGGRPGLIIEVEDDGPGIPREQSEAIFKRGYRVDTAVEGHGIGLAIVKELVEQVFNGELRLADAALGGTRVIARMKF
jgi:two-component system sensor histidine kinase PhoQ